jgi:hypothetical protein
MVRVSMANYPVSSPFRPPEECAAQVARLRRWTFLLASAAALVLIAAVASVVLWVNVIGDSPDSATGEADSPADAKPQPVAAPSFPADRTAHLLDALGGLSGAHLSQSSLNLDLLAEAVEKKIKPKEEGEKLLATMEDLMNEVDGYLKELKDAGLDAADQQAVERFCKVSAALRGQAAALRAYWKSGAQPERTAYETARQQALDALHELTQKQ